MKKMDRNQHSVYLLYYHLIMVIKYRRKVITDEISEQAELAKFINAYKSASSRLIKKDHPEIREKLWKEAFWSQSYCLLTTGGATVDVIREYIETQGEEDRRRRENRLHKYNGKIQEKDCI